MANREGRGPGQALGFGKMLGGNAQRVQDVDLQHSQKRPQPRQTDTQAGL